jgi:hypothetical protein
VLHGEEVAQQQAVKGDAVMDSNPYAASRYKDSYVYKHEKYAHLREQYDQMAGGTRARQAAEAEAEAKVLAAAVAASRQ